MENNAPKLDERRSIEIITSVINDTRARLTHSTGIQMLIWGYTVALTSLVVAAVTRYAFTPATSIIWLAAPVIGLCCTWLNDRLHPSSEYPRNRILRTMWWTAGIIAAIFIMIAAHFFTTSLLLAVATIVTGAITSEKTVTASGIAAIIASAVIPINRFLHPAAALFCTGEADPYLRVASYEAWFALTIAIMLIIPGHILHSRKRALTGNDNPQKKNLQ